MSGPALARCLVLTGDAEREGFYTVEGPEPLDPAAVAEHGPDAQLVVPTDGEAIAARCSLWWRQVPAFAGHRVGFIGHYAAADTAAVTAMLRAACDELAVRGCSLAVGPVNGSIWRRYRAITWRGHLPTFFLEPDNPDSWPEHFAAAGFSPVATYHSAFDAQLRPSYPVTDPISAALAADGVTLRGIDLDDFDRELRAFYSIVEASFGDSPLYTPTTEAAFVAQYRSLLPFVEPELALLAIRDGRPVGFVFTLPDVAHTEQPDTVIIKTMAVLPELRGRGLGVLLGGRCCEAAHRLGYRKAIHALMHDASTSRRISSTFGEVMRRYAVFGRTLRARP